jgi:hypothetical protein
MVEEASFQQKDKDITQGWQNSKTEGTGPWIRCQRGATFPTFWTVQSQSKVLQIQVLSGCSFMTLFLFTQLKSTGPIYYKNVTQAGPE